MSEKKINIALLASFTSRGIADVLHKQCQVVGIAPQIYVGGYNQYVQEILNAQSELYLSNPELVILFVDTRALLGEHFFLPYHISDDERRALIEEKFNELTTLVERIKQNSLAKILLHNFEIPAHSPLGILENKQQFGLVEALETLNFKLREQYKNDPRVFVFDYERFCAGHGKKQALDYKMYYLGDVKINPQLIPALCQEYLGYLKPLLSLNKKCLVLDCDNTLWGGVIGEDGLGGIRLGPTPEGRSFFEFQKYLLSLFQRGVVLAINSKNNLDDVMQVLREHPHMVLKEEHFAATRINWEDKASNMRALAKELNLGLDSFVFLDDERMNRELIRNLLPEVVVVDLPEDPAQYVRMIAELNEFNTLALTDEDKDRGKMYATERQRKELQTSLGDLNEYLKNLKTVVKLEKANALTIPRIAQLTQKTNQFNMTTRRYAQEEIERLAKDPNFMVISLSSQDRFGDNGLVGVAIVEKGIPQWRIDSFLLSCRIIGRRIEETLLAHIVQEAKSAGAEILKGEFISSKKNSPAKEFYKNNKFVLVKDGDQQDWEYDLAVDYPFSDLIQVIE